MDLIIFSSLSAIAVFGASYMYIACAVIAFIGTLLPIPKAVRSREKRKLA
nr:hypothetical protein [Ectobacillus panaciterrae]